MVSIELNKKIQQWLESETAKFNSEYRIKQQNSTMSIELRTETQQWL